MNRALLPALALTALSLSAQDSRFEARSRLVILPVTVTDANGRPIDGLQSSDFTVLDNGRPQKVTVDTTGTGVAPIALVIAVQSSNISAAVLEKVRKIPGMIQPLITGDRGCAALLAFAARMTWLQDCTNDDDALQTAFKKLRPAIDKDGRMLDAVNAAVARLNERPNARRVIFLISESRDRGSEAALSAVTVAAQKAGVAVYTATYSAFRTAFTADVPVARTRRSVEAPVPNVYGTVDGLPSFRADPKLTSPDDSLDAIAGITELMRLNKENSSVVLAAATGGITLPFTRQKGLENAIEKLGAELHTQYILSFTPEDHPPGYHSLTVHIAREGEVHVRARPGYWFAGAASR